VSLDHPEFFINRELSWLAFNRRVLEEAQDRTTPLLERLKFLTIVSSNLDEFFMVRVAGLKRLVDAEVSRPCPAGLTPQEQLARIAREVRRIMRDQSACFARLVRSLGEHRLALQTLDRPERAVTAWGRRYFQQELYPVLTPVLLNECGQQGPGCGEAGEAAASDEGRPVGLAASPAGGGTALAPPATMIAGQALYLAVLLAPTPGAPALGGARKPLTGPLPNRTHNRIMGATRRAAPLPLLAVVQVSRATPRLIQAPAEDRLVFLLQESIIRAHLGDLFPGRTILGQAVFRVTRDADLEVHDEEYVDLLAAMEHVLVARRRSRAVRLEIEAGAPPALRERLARHLGVDPADVYPVHGPLDLTGFRTLLNLPGFDHLRYPFHQPVMPTAFAQAGPVWPVISAGDVLLHHPYESFEPVVRLLNQAADDPDVLAVKQMLYRTSGDSPVIAALERAARSGKQVTVLVELRARFDEAKNIDWARRLEDAGCQVVYGVAGLKTHAKVCLVVRREAAGVRRYVHLGTGNYNEVTAQLYEDLGLLTAADDFGADASALFNAITGLSEPVTWRRLEVAPRGLRQRLLDLIEREARRSTPQEPGLILAKMNSLADVPIIKALYRAAQAGVRIRLNVRGICCLRPGLPGTSEHIEVVSIVDRFLEHARIFYFKNGGDEEVYLSSADWMPRNLSSRIEVMFPVRAAEARRRVKEVLEVCLGDNVKARRLTAEGTWRRVRRGPKDGPPRQSQVTFQALARAAASAAEHLRLSRFQPLQAPESDRSA
jgi:polyphosphate kinase